MDYATAYAAFNGTLPATIRESLFYGSAENSKRIIRNGAALAHQQRCRDLVASLCAWRLCPYDRYTAWRMLSILSRGLAQARHQAVMCSDSVICSAVAVTAPPNKTI